MKIVRTRGVYLILSFFFLMELTDWLSRFQTRMQYVRNAEHELAEKKKHCKIPAVYLSGFV